MLPYIELQRCDSKVRRLAIGLRIEQGSVLRTGECGDQSLLGKFIGDFQLLLGYLLLLLFLQLVKMLGLAKARDVGSLSLDFGKLVVDLEVLGLELLLLHLLACLAGVLDRFLAEFEVLEALSVGAIEVA